VLLLLRRDADSPVERNPSTRPRPRPDEEGCGERRRHQHFSSVPAEREFRDGGNQEQLAQGDQQINTAVADLAVKWIYHRSGTDPLGGLAIPQRGRAGWMRKWRRVSRLTAHIGSYGGLSPASCRATHHGLNGGREPPTPADADVGAAGGACGERDTAMPIPPAGVSDSPHPSLPLILAAAVIGASILLAGIAVTVQAWSEQRIAASRRRSSWPARAARQSTSPRAAIVRWLGVSVLGRRKPRRRHRQQYLDRADLRRADRLRRRDAVQCELRPAVRRGLWQRCNGNDPVANPIGIVTAHYVVDSTVAPQQAGERADRRIVGPFGTGCAVYSPIGD
jgi:hypothetical protein